MIPDASLGENGQTAAGLQKRRGSKPSCQCFRCINDAAAAVVVMSKDKALELGPALNENDQHLVMPEWHPRSWGWVRRVAIARCLQQAGLKFEDIEYWEINEAFAAQFLGVGLRTLKEDYGIEPTWISGNLNGSGIALGHPRAVLHCA